MRVRNLTISYGGEPVLEGATIDVGTGQFVSLVGPSGSGKSSMLRAIIGLQKPLAGIVDAGFAPSEIGMLFQDDALLPWKTARENVALGLTFNGIGRTAALAQGGFLARAPRPQRFRRAFPPPSQRRTTQARRHCPGAGDAA